MKVYSTAMTPSLYVGKNSVKYGKTTVDLNSVADSLRKQLLAETIRIETHQPLLTIVRDRVMRNHSTSSPDED